MAGTIVGSRSEQRPVGEGQQHVGAGPDREGRALIVGETKLETAVAHDFATGCYGWRVKCNSLAHLAIEFVWLFDSELFGVGSCD